MTVSMGQTGARPPRGQPADSAHDWRNTPCDRQAPDGSDRLNNQSGGAGSGGGGRRASPGQTATMAGTHPATPFHNQAPVGANLRRGDVRAAQRPNRTEPSTPPRQSFGTARRNPSGSHLGSPLSPGRAVLTRGVSRRSRSVACIRADASPNEVLHPYGATAGQALSTSAPRPWAPWRQFCALDTGL